VFWVPGSLELPVMALALAERGNHDAIVCLGCVIRGETYHFELVAGKRPQASCRYSWTRASRWHLGC